MPNLEAYSERVPADYVGQVLNDEWRRTMANTRMNDYCKGGGRRSRQCRMSKSGAKPWLQKRVSAF